MTDPTEILYIRDELTAIGIRLQREQKQSPAPNEEWMHGRLKSILIRLNAVAIESERQATPAVVIHVPEEPS